MSLVHISGWMAFLAWLIWQQLVTKGSQFTYSSSNKESLLEENRRNLSSHPHESHHPPTLNNEDHTYTQDTPPLLHFWFLKRNENGFRNWSEEKASVLPQNPHPPPTTLTILRSYKLLQLAASSGRHKFPKIPQLLKKFLSQNINQYAHSAREL